MSRHYGRSGPNLQARTGKNRRRLITPVRAGTCGRMPKRSTTSKQTDGREPIDGDLDLEMGNRIRDLYEARGWSQQELAWRANVSITKVNRIITGAQGMSAQILLRLARAFDVSADYLLGLTQDKRPRS
jgi:ribosome-binding protein aMBF1 (putative translation factor)